MFFQTFSASNSSSLTGYACFHVSLTEKGYNCIMIVRLFTASHAQISHHYVYTNVETTFSMQNILYLAVLRTTADIVCILTHQDVVVVVVYNTVVKEFFRTFFLSLPILLIRFKLEYTVSQSHCDIFRFISIPDFIEQHFIFNCLHTNHFRS